MSAKNVDIKELFERGMHYGHLARRWNPKMKSYIYKEQDGIHVLDLTQTQVALQEAHNYIKDLVAQGGTILFVATKKQAKDYVKKTAIELGVPYVTERWVGGILTNWDTVKKNIDRLNDYKKNGAPQKGLTKKEQLLLAKQMSRLDLLYEGLVGINKIPDALFILDVRRERLAVLEAKRTKVAIVGVCDTNSDPSDVSLVIPANDDAIKSIEYLVDTVADAIRAGRELAQVADANKDEAQKQNGKLADTGRVKSARSPEEEVTKSKKSKD